MFEKCLKVIKFLNFYFLVLRNMIEDKDWIYVKLIYKIKRSEMFKRFQL